MTESIMVSGGGAITVATEEVSAAALALEQARDLAATAARQLATIDRMVGGALLGAAAAPSSAARAEQQLDRAMALAARLESLSATTATALRLSADAYGTVEHSVEQITRAVLARLGYGVGFVLPLLAAVAIPAAVAAAAGILSASLLAPGGPKSLSHGVRAWLRDNSDLLNSPITVALVGGLVTSVDDVAAGALRLPPLLQSLLGDEGLGVLGVSSTATALLAAGPFGIFAESPVTARSTVTGRVDAAPTGLADRIDRIPDAAANEHGEQVRIDRYSSPGAPDRFDVFIGGTADFSPVAGDEPFDMTSNVVAMTPLPAGSYRAVEAALADAGVTSTSEIAFTGYSQGATLAMALAASGDYSTVGVLAVGGPFGAVDVPEGIPVIELEHTDDLVTVLGGARPDRDSVVVSREAFASTAPPPGVPVAAHYLGVYRETAVLAEQSSDERLREAMRVLDDHGHDGATVTSTMYLAERVRAEG